MRSQHANMLCLCLALAKTEAIDKPVYQQGNALSSIRFVLTLHTISIQVQENLSTRRIMTGFALPYMNILHEHMNLNASSFPFKRTPLCWDCQCHLSEWNADRLLLRGVGLTHLPMFLTSWTTAINGDDVAAREEITWWLNTSYYLFLPFYFLATTSLHKGISTHKIRERQLFYLRKPYLYYCTREEHFWESHRPHLTAFISGFFCTKALQEMETSKRLWTRALLSLSPKHCSLVSRQCYFTWRPSCKPYLREA